MPFKYPTANALRVRRYYRKHLVERRAYHRRYYRLNREKQRARAQRWWKTHPEASRAHKAVRLAVKFGVIHKPSRCSICMKKSNVEAHHYCGYAQSHWLDITWLCHSCHRLVHS